MESNEMVSLMMIVIVVVIAFPFIAAIMSFFDKRRDRLSESPIDVHEMLYHKLKKAAKRIVHLNKRSLRIKWLVCLGDEDVPGLEGGRVVGILPSRDCYQIFVKSGMLRRAQWMRVPIELMRDVHGRALRVDCRGFRPHENYQVPMFSNNVDEEKRNYYEDVLDRDFEFLVLREKNGELFEQNINAMIEAVSAKKRAPQIYGRDDHMMNQSETGSNQGEEQPVD